MTNQNPIQLNIHFRVSQELEDQIIEVSNQIAEKYGSNWKLDSTISIPHFSMYLLAIPQKNLAKAQELAQTLSKDFKPLRIEVDGLFVAPSGQIMLAFNKQNIYYQYHLKILNVFNKLREGVQRKKYLDEAYFKSLPNKAKKYLRRYGSRYVLDQFDTHITISSFGDLTTSEIVAKEFKALFTNKTTKLEFFEITQDDYDTNDAVKIVFSKKLKS